MNFRKVSIWLWALDTRSTELVLAYFLTMRGFWWLTGVAEMTSQVYKPMYQVAQDQTWGALLVVIGLSQIIAVLINGNWRRTPLLRVSSLMISGFFYMLIATAFIQGLTGPAIQSGATMYLFAAVSVWCALNIVSKIGR